MLTYDFEQSVGYWIITTATRYERAFNAALTEHGITYRQVQVLSKLIHRGPQPQTVLAEEMQVEPPTLVGILDRMEREGWITRETVPSDRRKKIINIGPHCSEVWAKIVVVAKELRAAATLGMTEDEFQTLIRLLRQLQSNLQVPVADAGEKATS